MIKSMVLSQVFKISALLTFGLDHSLLWGQGEGICTLGMFGSIPPLYSLDASPNHSYHTPVVVIKNVSVQFSRSVVSDSLRPHESQPPDLSVYHQLPEFTQTHVHRVGDAIQPSHPLSSPSTPAPNPYQHQGLFQWVNSSHEVAIVLEFQLQYQSFQWTPGTDLL